MIVPLSPRENSQNELKPFKHQRLRGFFFSPNNQIIHYFSKKRCTIGAQGHQRKKSAPNFGSTSVKQAVHRMNILTYIDN